jgi:quercetin dioxygenase-like cupin family protein
LNYDRLAAYPGSSFNLPNLCLGEIDMDIVRFVDPPACTSSKLGDIARRQLQGGEASSADFAQVAYLAFSRRARVPMEAAPIGMVYVVAEGALTVEQADGVKHTLMQGDSVFVPANEARAVVNDSDTPAALIVITPPHAK